MKTLISFAVLFLLAGCATTGGMQSWIGKPESELLSRWGPPDATATTNEGKKIVTWKHTWAHGNNIYTCRRTFTVGSGVLERWSAVGDCPKQL